MTTTINKMIQQAASPTPQINVGNPQFKANPFTTYAWLRAEAPVYQTSLPNKQKAWLVSRYEDVSMVLKDERFVKNKKRVMTPEQLKKLPWVPGMFKPLETNILDTDAPDHTRLRALIHKAFTPHLVEQMRDRIQALATELLDAAGRKGTVDLIQDYALPFPLTIIGEILGVPAADRPKFHRLTKAIVAAETNPNLLTIMPNLWSFLRYLHRLFNERRANPTDDLVTSLVRAEAAGDKPREDEMLSMH